MLLLYIVGACVTGGALSLLGAALLTFRLPPSLLPRLVSFAVGVLLAAAFLGILPEAFAQSTDHTGLFAAILGGLIGFFLLEKLALWRHSHEQQVDDARGHAGLLILMGDGVHNFADGILIAAAFLTDPMLGLTTAVAVIAHEIPQEMGDFLILLNAGFSRAKAFWLNLASSLASVAGGVLGYFLLNKASSLLPYILALAAASFIYIAIADLMPGMNKRWETRATLWQLVLIASGAGLVAGQSALLG